MARKPAKGGGGARGARAPRAPTAYEKRIERGMAKGLTRQQARGHKPKEHIERKAKEIARYGMTTAQRAALRRGAERQAKRLGLDPADKVKGLERVVRRRGVDAGMDAFHAWQRKIATLRKAKRARVRKRIRKDGTLMFTGSPAEAQKRRDKMNEMAAEIGDFLDDLAEEWDVDTWELMFYN